MGGLKIIAVILSAGAFVYTAPAALPEKKRLGTTKGAFMTALCLVCAFLLSEAVYILSKALWGVSPAVLLCVLSAFAFSKTAEYIFFSECTGANLPAVCALLALFCPAAESAWQTVLYALCTAVGVIVMLTALSSVIRRISHSDAPSPLKGLPSLLLVLGLCALAFGGF